MRVYGLTGGIGAGKSEAARCFAALGIPIIEADEIGRDALSEHHPIAPRVIEAFGPLILQGATIDRAKLAAIVFDDPEALSRLQSIVHPHVYDEIVRQSACLKKEGHDRVIVEAALLAEGNTQDRAHDMNMTGLIVVTCPVELRLQRLVEQRGMEEGDARKRIAAQCPPGKKLPFAAHVIDNGGSLEGLCLQVEAVAREL